MTSEELVKIANAMHGIADLIKYADTIRRLHDCNDCGIKKRCKYAPTPGNVVRINCPLWQDKEHHGCNGDYCDL